MAKFEFTGETKEFEGRTVRRIRRTAEWGASEVPGGWLERESNLSQEGSAWVADNAVVIGSSFVKDASLIKGDAVVVDSRATGHVLIQDTARVQANAYVAGFMTIMGDVVLDGGCYFGHGFLEHGTHRACPIWISASQYPIGWAGVPGFIRSGCISESVEWWDANVGNCAAYYGYTEEQQNEYRLLFECVRNWMILKGVDKPVEVVDKHLQNA